MNKSLVKQLLEKLVFVLLNYRVVFAERITIFSGALHSFASSVPFSEYSRMPLGPKMNAGNIRADFQRTKLENPTHKPRNF